MKINFAINNFFASSQVFKILPLEQSVIPEPRNFSIPQGAATATTTRRPSWIRSKVSRVQEWVGWKRTTRPAQEYTTSRKRIRDRVRERFGWTRATTVTPVTHEVADSGFLDRMKKKIGVPGAVGAGVGVGVGVAASRVTDHADEGWLDKMRRKMGFSGGTLDSGPTNPTTTPKSFLAHAEEKLGFHTDLTTVPTVTMTHNLDLTTTKRSLIDRAKEKLGFHINSTTSPLVTTTPFDKLFFHDLTTVPTVTLPPEPATRGFFGRAFDKIKNMLNIGSTDPNKPNLVVKYGKKAVEKLGPKVLEKIKKVFEGALTL